MTQFQNIPYEMKRLRRWVCVWDSSKIPMQATQRKAATQNVETWADYKTALKAILCGVYDGLGFMLGDGIVGIDVDIGGTPEADDILEQFPDTYAERSRSGRGFHIYCKGHLPFAGKNNGNGIEIYEGARYFICTGDIIEKHSPMLLNAQNSIDYVLEKYFTAETKKPLNEPSVALYKVSYEKPSPHNIRLQPNYPAVEQGGRHLAMLSYAGKLWSSGWDPKEIFLEVMRANQAGCKPPLGEREIQNIVRSIKRYER